MHSLNPGYHGILFGFVPGRNEAYGMMKRRLGAVTYSLKT